MATKGTRFEQRLQTLRRDGKEEELSIHDAFIFVYDTLETCKFMAWDVIGEHASTQDVLAIYDLVVRRLESHRSNLGEQPETDEH